MHRKSSIRKLAEKLTRSNSQDIQEPVQKPKRSWTLKKKKPEPIPICETPKKHEPIQSVKVEKSLNTHGSNVSKKKNSVQNSAATLVEESPTKRTGIRITELVSKLGSLYEPLPVLRKNSKKEIIAHPLQEELQDADLFTELPLQFKHSRATSFKPKTLKPKTETRNRGHSCSQVQVELQVLNPFVK